MSATPGFLWITQQRLLAIAPSWIPKNGANPARISMRFKVFPNLFCRQDV
jgi:hypothetical protein